MLSARQIEIVKALTAHRSMALAAKFLNVSQLSLTRRAGISLLATLGLVGLAQAADVATAQPPEQGPPPPNCWASLRDFLNSTALDCPLTYAGFTLYGTIDMGVGYQSNGAPFNGSYPDGVDYLISKESYGAKWLWSPNPTGQSQLGVSMSEPLGAGWRLIGDLEFGFDPYSLQLANGPRSLVENNGVPLANQSANSDSSRAGQIDNSQGFLGLSHATFGDLKFGRVDSLTLDAVSAYDPMSAAYAFSVLGASSALRGFGLTELARSNTAFKYRWTNSNFRVAALAQVGGYDQGNGSAGKLEAQIGADFGGLSVDAVFSRARDAVSLSNYTSLPSGDTQDDLKATLSDNAGVSLLAKYAWGPIKLYGGLESSRLSNPSGSYPNGFTSLGGYTVLGSAITYDAYTINKILRVGWTGAKYSITDQLEVRAAVYYETQNDYYTGTCTGTGVNTSSDKCAGSLDAFSVMLDYRPRARVDLYAGVMLSRVYGGLASGYQAVSNVDPTVGLRVKF
ncbi:MAG TPA: porin [Roseiarcus sp.]|nr:porin [Roseiarcus sp.]